MDSSIVSTKMATDSIIVIIYWEQFLRTKSAEMQTHGKCL